MARHDRGRRLAERTGLHVMGEVSDHGAIHLEVDLDRRATEFGVGRGAGIGVGKPAQTWDVPGQLDDALVVDVIQHMMEVPPDRPWRPGVTVLYMEGPGRNTVRLVPQASGGCMSAPSAGDTPVLWAGRTE